MSAHYTWYVRAMEPTPNDTSPGLSRSGLLLGAAGAVGVAALTALPGTAAAAASPVRTTLRNTTKFSITAMKNASKGPPKRESRHVHSRRLTSFTMNAIGVVKKKTGTPNPARQNIIKFFLS